MSAITKEHARDLAVSYSSFNAALDKNALNSIVVYGECLIIDQRKTGVEMYSEKLIQSLINEARYEKNKISA